MARASAEGQTEMSGLTPAGSGRNPREDGAEASACTVRREDSPSGVLQLMEAVVERENMRAAFSRVKRNKGAAGVDGMTVAELGRFLRREWPRIKQELLADRYVPQPVLGVEIPSTG